MNHKFSVALRYLPLLTIFFINTPVTAQELKARDILGIKLGATSEEVESVLKQVKPKLDIYVSVDTGESGFEEGPILSITAQTNPNYSAHIIEYIVVKFGTVTGQVVSIQRTHNDKDGFDREIIFEAMKQKYGTFLSGKDKYHIGIGYNTVGKLDKKCIDWALTGIKECGDSFSVKFDGSNYQKTDLYYSYEAGLIDHKALIYNIKTTEAKFVAKDQEMARKAQEKARSVKPAL